MRKEAAWSDVDQAVAWVSNVVLKKIPQESTILLRQHGKHPMHILACDKADRLSDGLDCQFERKIDAVPSPELLSSCECAWYRPSAAI